MSLTSNNLIDELPELEIIEQALLDASKVIGEENLPQSVRDAWQSLNKLNARVNRKLVSLKREATKKYRDGRFDGFKEGWNADPLKIEANLQGKCPKRKK